MIDVRKVLRDLTTGKDSQTHDVARWSWLMSWCAVLGHSIWSSLSGHFPSVAELAGALTAVAAGHGIAIGAKGSTEPDPEDAK